MRALRIITIILFFVIIVTPILTFNFEQDAVSLIDNRKLAANPFSRKVLEEGGDLTNNIESYISDRLGFRDEMILSYTVLKDKLFNKMVHPNYIYGREGYVFGAGLTVNNPYTEYHEAFADMVRQIQEYCDARSVPFLFVFNPAKPAVLTDYIPVGTNYDRSWVDSFLVALDERQVRYIDNTQLLKEKTATGEMVFNQKYDANHWNDLGAYYGTNAILERLNQYIPVHINSLDEIMVGEKLQTSLPVSEFPINEMVPSISIDMTIDTANRSMYDEELYRHPSFDSFGYYINEKRIEDGAPRALVFQGSYMNGFGYKFLANAFSEYIHIHDYQNVIDFSYYFNIFQPDCVIFEVAEYTFEDLYFSYDNMSKMDLNPTLESILNNIGIVESQSLKENTISIKKGKMLTTIQWDYVGSSDYAWLKMDREYDMKKTDNGYEVTILSSTYDKYIDEAQIFVSNGENIELYAP